MSNDETNNEVNHILDDAKRREVTLDSGKTIAVYEGTSTRGEMGKIAPWNQVNADAKRWRTQGNQNSHTTGNSGNIETGCHQSSKKGSQEV